MNGVAAPDAWKEQHRRSQDALLGGSSEREALREHASLLAISCFGAFRLDCCTRQEAECKTIEGLDGEQAFAALYKRARTHNSNYQRSCQMQGTAAQASGEDASLATASLRCAFA